MKYSNDGPPLSESADQQRMRQYLDACQAAVDAWDDFDIHDGWAKAVARQGLRRSAELHDHLAGAAKARAKQAVYTADNLL